MKWYQFPYGNAGINSLPISLKVSGSPYNFTCKKIEWIDIKELLLVGSTIILKGPNNLTT
jgi:hypothetical protein